MKKPEFDAFLISPGNAGAIYQGLAEDFSALEPPVWAALLTKGLMRQGFRVKLIDQSGSFLSAEQICNTVAEERPRLVGIVVYGQQPSASTQNMTAALVLAEKIRDRCPESKILLLGGHPSALPALSLRESKADFVCQGEGLYTLRALLQLSDLSDSSQLKKVPGLWFWLEGAIASTPPAALIPAEELAAELPGLAWDQLPMGNYRAHNWHCFDHLEERKPYAALYTSLGCPFHCSFCCINAPFGKNTIRYWDPALVIAELETLAVRYGVKNVKIVDEMFVLHEERVNTLCDLILERGLRFNFWAYARVDTVKPRLLEKMERAGFHWLCLGIESSSKHVRDGVKKGRFQEPQVFETVKAIQGAGIRVIGNFIFGLPDDDFSSMRSTLRMALDLDLDFANFYSAMAYPGSKLYELAVEKGWRLPERWQDFSQHAYGTLPLPTEHLSAEEVLAFRDWAWKEFFSSERYLSHVERKFGAAVVSHLKAVSAKALPRKFSGRIAENAKAEPALILPAGRQ